MAREFMFGRVHSPDRWETTRRLFEEVSQRNLRNQRAELDILEQQQEQERKTAMLERWRAGVSGVQTREDVQRLASEIPIMFGDPAEQKQRLSELQAIAPDVPIEEVAARKGAITYAETAGKLAAQAAAPVTPQEPRTLDELASQRISRGDWTEQEGINFLNAARGREGQNIVVSEVAEGGRKYDVARDKLTGEEKWRVPKSERDPAMLYFPEYDKSNQPTGELIFSGDPQIAEFERSRLYQEIANEVKKHTESRKRKRTQKEAEDEIRRREEDAGVKLKGAQGDEIREEEITVKVISPEGERLIEGLERNLRAVYKSLGVPLDTKEVIEEIKNTPEEDLDAILGQARRRALGESPQVPRKTPEGARFSFTYE